MTLPQVFLLPRGLPWDGQMERLLRLIDALPKESGYQIEVTERKSIRSLQQNKYLWGVVYPEILAQAKEQLGEDFGGYRADDLHEYLLGEWSGWEVVKVFGKTKHRPIKRSSRLGKAQFSEYLGFIFERMAEHGIVIPDPDPELAT